MLNIQVTSGTGEGPTQMAAFDAALLDAGVANYNLMLSSVIPGGSVVRQASYLTPSEEYGHRLYVVMARAHTTAGSEAWAGLGWTQEPATGRGLFVELHGGDRTPVDNDIKATLDAMIASRPPAYDGIGSEIVGTQCP
jgi:arginine decarboxylase